MKKNIEIFIDKKDSLKRLDSALSNKIDDMSRTRLKNLILEGNVKVNNQIIINPSKKINYKDSISLRIPESKKIDIKPYNFKLDIVYEDKDLMIINKPAGLVIHPGAGNKDKTLVNALIKYCNKNLSSIGGELRPGIVHRIDKDTSGLIVVAKNDKTHENLSKQFKNKLVERKYLALVWGVVRPQKGIIKSFITRSKRNRQLMEVSDIKGKYAVTNYKTLEVFQSKLTPTVSLIECILGTGRTHQIRVHMSYKGNSIIGDKSYQKKNKKFKKIDFELNSMIKNINRQFLHAKSIGFLHPNLNKKIHFEIDLPSDLLDLLKKLRKLSN